MDKERSKFCEKARVIVAKELDMPPDDIDMCSIMDCIERGIAKNCENKNGEMVMSPANNEEEKMMISDCGSHVLKLVFTNSYPFEGFVEDYEEWYVSKFINNIYKKRNA